MKNISYTLQERKVKVKIVQNFKHIPNELYKFSFNKSPIAGIFHPKHMDLQTNLKVHLLAIITLLLIIKKTMKIILS